MKFKLIFKFQNGLFFWQLSVNIDKYGKNLVKNNYVKYYFYIYKNNKN